MRRSKYTRPAWLREQGEGGQGTADKPRLTTSAMIASLAGADQRTKPAPFGHALAALAETRPEIVGLTADLGKYTDLHIFAQAHPDRFYQMGMAEQLLMSAAAGMAREGFMPFATTYAVFAARRAYDFICMAIAEENLNVKIVCALPGLTTGYGPSHQATEDIAIFRGMPNMTIVDPCDAHEIEQIVPAIAAHAGPVYMRLLRGNVPLVLDEYDYTFELGKAKLLRDGNDVLIISSGFMTMRALEAVEALRGRPRRCRRAARADHQAARRGDDPEGSRAQGPDGGRGREPHRHGRPRRGDRGLAAALRREASGLPADRLAGRVPRCRGAPDAPRALRHLGSRDVAADQGLALIGPPHQAHPHFRGGSHVARAGLRRPARRTSRPRSVQRQTRSTSMNGEGNIMVTHTNRRTFLKGVGLPRRSPGHHRLHP